MEHGGNHGVSQQKFHSKTENTIDLYTLMRGAIDSLLGKPVDAPSSPPKVPPVSDLLGTIETLPCLACQQPLDQDRSDAVINDGIDQLCSYCVQHGPQWVGLMDNTSGKTAQELILFDARNKEAKRRAIRCSRRAR